ncbi:hypothetical protein ABXJ76_05610 [Methylobacter sp. G7]|uniref:hypothetical protein n=1 Tax=Methylobacter sp. G7 TaxID=3230117 RepID=UPI003D803E2D
MQFFDRIEHREINGFHELFAIDEQKNEAYLLRDLIVRAESSAITGNWLYVNSIKKRTSFENEKLMNDFSENLMRQANELDAENNKKKHGHP